MRCSCACAVRPNHSLKVSPNGVAHWACSAGASPQFCAACPARHTVGPTLARTLGRMNHRHLALVTFTLTTLLASCGEAQYRDISSTTSQQSTIGQICEVISGLRAHGVTRNIEREKKTDYVSIWNPGFTGPEMTWSMTLPPRTKIQILEAQECSNCPLDRLVRYRVKVTPEPPEFQGKPAYLRAESKAMPHVNCSTNAA
jgi:hypothetical protein